MILGHRTANEYYRDLFGEKVYRLALEGGRTCPNRDGSRGLGGCIFCSAGGSGDFASRSPEEAKAYLRLHGKHTGSRFIAYYQSYTATYGPPEFLFARLEEAIRDPEIVGLDLATRPDCLPPETVDALQTVRGRKPLWVELGLQTAVDRTAKLINRCWDLPELDRAAAALEKRDIPVILHVILGLPGESREEILQTIRYVNTLPVHGVKLQMLHVLRGTRLADLWAHFDKSGLPRTDYFPSLQMEDYLSLLYDCVSELRKDIVLYRLTGDGPRSLLLSPMWSADKKRVLNAVSRTFRNPIKTTSELVVCSDPIGVNSC